MIGYGHINFCDRGWDRYLQAGTKAKKAATGGCETPGGNAKADKGSARGASHHGFGAHYGHDEEYLQYAKYIDDEKYLQHAKYINDQEYFQHQKYFHYGAACV